MFFRLVAAFDGKVVGRGDVFGIASLEQEFCSFLERLGYYAEKFTDDFLEPLRNGFNRLFNEIGKGVRESAGLNRLGIGNERVLQRRLSQ